jgi:hypothetical protein
MRCLKQVNKWYGYAGALGLLSFGFHFVAVGSTASALVGDFIYVALVVLLALAGINAKRAGVRPFGRGAAIGLIYGVISDVGSILFPLSHHELALEMRREFPTQNAHRIAQLVAEASALDARAAALLTNIVVSVIMGVVFAWLGSLVAKKATTNK